MTPKSKRKTFLETLAKTANVFRSAESAGIPRQTVYSWRERDKNFAADWDRAVEFGTDALEDEAVRRAYEGTLKPVFQRGEEVGQIREFSDVLLIFMLKSRRPHIYRENVKVEHVGSDDGPILITQIEHVSTIRGNSNGTTNGQAPLQLARGPAQSNGEH